MKKGYKKIRNLVFDILEQDPNARNSDMYLYLRVCETLNASAIDKPFGEVLANLQDLGLPCFETIRRTRQKLQEIYPKFAACDTVQDFRTLEEIRFKKEFGK